MCECIHVHVSVCEQMYVQHSGARWENFYLCKSSTGLDMICRVGREGGQNRIEQDKDRVAALHLLMMRMHGCAVLQGFPLL